MFYKFAAMKFCVPLLLASIFLFGSCRQIDMAEQNLYIPSKAWNATDSLTGNIRISDTSAAYNISIVIRHTDAYNYNNIWLLIGMQGPGEAMEYRQVNVPLGTDATGWFGSGMNDIWECRHTLTVNRRFSRSGSFAFSIKQIMRDEPLKEVLNAGIRLDKVSLP